MGQFFLCIDDTDDKTKSIGTGEIASHIYDRLLEMGCQMRYQITRHQLLLDPRIAYTSHNSSMCMEGSGPLRGDEIWKVAEEMLAQYRSPVSNPGICLYLREKSGTSALLSSEDSGTAAALSSVQFWQEASLETSASAEKEAAEEEKLIAFGLRAKKEVLTLQDARKLADEIEGIRLEAPAGNGNGQIGALAGIGLRLYGSDGTFRGKRPVSEPVTETVARMKARIRVNRIWDGMKDRILEDHELVRAVKQVKLVYRDHEPIAAVRMCEDGIYEICNKAGIYEQTITKASGVIEDCVHFQWDNDRGEQWSEKAGSCENCLYRRLTDHGMKCTRPKAIDLRRGEGKGQGGGKGRGEGKGCGDGKGRGEGKGRGDGKGHGDGKGRGSKHKSEG